MTRVSVVSSTKRNATLKTEKVLLTEWPGLRFTNLDLVHRSTGQFIPEHLALQMSLTNFSPMTFVVTRSCMILI
jgi:hypothetical protein